MAQCYELGSHSMNFWLRNIEYQFDVTPDAICQFEDRTGKCLIGTIRKVRIEFSKCVSERLSEESIAARMSDVLTFRQVAYMLHSLASQKSSRVTINEIQDAMIQVGDVPKESNLTDKRSACYSYVLIYVCNSISEHMKLVEDEKK